MPLFKSKEKEPESAAPPVEEPKEEPKYVTVEQFNDLQKTIGGLAEGVKAMSSQSRAYQPPQAPAQPAEDPLKGVKDKIGRIDQELDSLTDKIDQAVYEGKGAGALLNKQRQLMTERTDLQMKLNAPASDPRIEAGMNTINSLTDEVLQGKMPHLTLDPVKASYERYINQLPIEQRMNPETKRGCYNLAVGENFTAIEEARRQEWLRDQANQDPQPPGTSASGRDGHNVNYPEGIPTPEEHFSADALNTIKNSKHRDPENYVRSLGYKDWEDYINKTRDEEE